MTAGPNTEALASGAHGSVRDISIEAAGRSQLLLWGVAAVLLGSVSWAFFHFPYLPMVDLPQHAAQLSEWIHLNDPSYGFSNQFELNWQTPYLLQYLLARPFVPLIGIVAALKLVVLSTLFATVAVYYLLARSVAQEEWLCLLGLPLSFGFSFYFGFINFLLATPLILATVIVALGYGRQPTLRRGIGFAVLLGVTFLTHAFGCAIAAACSFFVTARRVESWRSLLRNYWPLFAGLALIVPWLPGFFRSPDISSHPEQWLLSWERIRELPLMLLAADRADHRAMRLGVWVLVVVILSLGSPARAWSRYGLLAIALGAFFLAPFEFRGISFVYERFAALVVPGLILAAGGHRSLLPPWLRRAGIVALTSVWVYMFVGRLREFNREAGAFESVIQALPRAQRVRPMIFARSSGAFPGAPLFLHFPAYYTAAKGGVLGYAFARYYECLVHYRPGVDMGMREDDEWHPERFDARREVPEYDYFIARADGDIARSSFRDSPKPIELQMSKDGWWVYRAKP